MFQIEFVDIETHILDKIEAKHGVSYEEAQEACFAERRHLRRAREGVYKLFGQTFAGRYLLVVLANVGGGVWRVVSARDMTRNERRLFQRQMGD